MGRWVLVALPLAILGIGFGDDQSVSFQRQVAPILVRRCLDCHRASKACANYRVDTFTRLMAESDAGKSIVPGKPGESLFLDLILLTEPTGRMPKNAEPLAEGEVRVLRRWIEQGAKSDGIDPDADLEKMVAKQK